MTPRSIRTAAFAFAVAALGACSGGDGKDPVKPPPPPVPGQLTVTLATPNPDDRALRATLSGPGDITAVQAAGAGYTVFSRGTGTAVNVALFGSLGNGAVLRFSVPDVNRAAGYTASVQEVADAGNALRSSLAGYQLVVAR